MSTSNQSKIPLKKLIESAVHFGHKTTYWSPKMKPFIWGEKNGVHLINVSLTAILLDQAREFLRSIAADNKQILWVGTKKAARDVIKRIGTNTHQPYVIHRWIGGTLTNHIQIKKSITKLLHYEDILAKADTSLYTKKELNKLQKIVNRLHANIGGIIQLRWPVGAIVLIDIKKEQAALQEAKKMGVPVVALVDTNSDPTLVDFIVPGNDDAPKAISIVGDYLAEGVKQGLAEAKAKQKEVVVEEEIIETEPAIATLLADDEEESNRMDNKAKIRKFKETAKKDSVRKQAAPKRS